VAPVKARWLVVALAVGIITGVCLDAWLRARYTLTPPARPGNVPAAAQWGGGDDGGNWFDCTRQPTGQYRCRVFSDQTGMQIADGLYRVVAEDVGGRLNPGFFRSANEIDLDGARLIRVP
jgi:hypothetical protein